MTTGKRILIIDDDADLIDVYKVSFKDSGYVIETAGNGAEGLEKIKTFKPDLIILDIMMPKMNGYEFCANLRKRDGEISIPIIFASAEDDNDKANAFMYGVVDYLVKPFKKSDLLDSVKWNVEIGQRWDTFIKDSAGIKVFQGNDRFREFLKSYADSLRIEPAVKEKIVNVSADKLYKQAAELKLDTEVLAKSLAGFYQAQYNPIIDPESVVLGFLPVSFLENNKIVVISDVRGNLSFVIAEPFNEELMSLLKSAADYPFIVTEPENISQLFDKTRDFSGVSFVNKSVDANEKKLMDRLEGAGITRLSRLLIAKAIKQNSDTISIVPGNDWSEVNFGTQNFFSVMLNTGMLSTVYYKMLAGLDIMDNRSPQKGGFEISFRSMKYIIQINTTPTDSGEICSIVIGKSS